MTAEEGPRGRNVLLIDLYAMEIGHYSSKLSLYNINISWSLGFSFLRAKDKVLMATLSVTHTVSSYV